MRVSIAICAGALALAPVGAATAQTIFASGDFAAGEYLNGSGGVTLGPGAYRFSFATTAPLDGFDGFVQKVSYYSEYCDEGDGEFYCGGNDVPTIPLFEQVSPTLYQLRIRVNPFVETFNPHAFAVRTEEFDECCTYGFDLYAGAAGSYAISYAAVPEPESWGLLILGFGAIGAAARRRSGLRAATS